MEIHEEQSHFLCCWFRKELKERQMKYIIPSPWALKIRGDIPFLGQDASSIMILHCLKAVISWPWSIVWGNQNHLETLLQTRVYKCAPLYTHRQMHTYTHTHTCTLTTWITMSQRPHILQENKARWMRKGIWNGLNLEVTLCVRRALVPQAFEDACDKAFLSSPQFCLHSPEWLAQKESCQLSV